MNKTKFFEFLFLIIFTVFFFIPISNLWGGQIVHKFPYAYGANDAFYHQIDLEVVHDLGSYKHNAFYLIGGFNDTIGYKPPLVAQLGSIMMQVSGFKSYDSIFILTILAFYFSCLGIYLFIKKFNRNLAFVSLPFSLLFFSKPFYTAIFWGQWHFIFAIQFFVFSAVLLSYSDLISAKNWIFYGFVLSAAFLSHVAEFIWAVLYFCFFILLWILLNKFKLNSLMKIKNSIINIILGGAASAVLSFYWIPIFLIVWLPGRTSKGVFSFTKALPGGYPVISIFEGYGLFLSLILVLGLILFLLNFIKKNKNHVFFSFFLFSLIAIYLNFLPSFDKSYQLRFINPLFSCVFFGFFIVFILNSLINFFKIRGKLFVYLLTSLIIFIFLSITLVSLGGMGSGIVAPDVWEGIEWINQNTDQDSSVFVGYGDFYSQMRFFVNFKRLYYLVDVENYFNLVKNGTLDRNIGKVYHTHLAYYRKSFFEYGNHYFENPDDFTKKVDLCSLDYYFISKYVGNKQIQEYNLLLLNSLYKSGFIENVFENKAIVILKNNNKGANCLSEV